METKKYALVTGASSGLGNATVLQLANEGYHVFAGIRREKDKHLFVSHQQHITPVMMDVAKRQEIEGAYQFIRETTQNEGLSVLVNNAGVNYISAFELADEDRERELFEVNLLGAMCLTRKLLPLLHQYVGVANQPAKIVNVSSMGGFFGLPWESAYHASKFAMIGFSQSLNYELARVDISVCCFVPGGMKTNIFRKSVEGFNVIQSGSSSHLAYYQRNERHMRKVMQGFERRAAPVENAAKAIAKLLRKRKMPLKKYFGMDARFVGLFTWLGLQNLLARQFSVQ